MRNQMEADIRMKLHFNSSKQWKDSAAISFAFIASIETFFAVSGISLDTIIPNQKWWGLLCIIFGVFAVFIVVIYLIISQIFKRGIKTEINGITVRVQQGDLFKADGWKVIPFNEFFDITVDDKVIAHNTLNGIMIDKYIDNVDEFRSALEADNRSPLAPSKSKNRKQYPLGCIKTYKDFMILAFTHFNNQNMAHISKVDYEHCLMKMWKEVSRTYANKPINLPLLGSGITRFDDVPHKSNFELLKCMLCTLKASGENINQPITILLTKDVIQEINIYEVKGMK
jgi:membrane protein YdbS with pleckstrin-like domain